MRIPQQLHEGIEREIAPFEGRELARASAELTRRYKGSSPFGSAFIHPVDRAAYLAARVPATLAAASRVLAEIRRLAPEMEVSSILDLGAGAGIALWAAAEVFPDLQRATLIEADREWIEIGKRLAAGSPEAVMRRAEWLQRDLRSPEEWPPHDLVVVSYALGELASSTAQALVKRALRSAAKCLVVIEPGTMKGFSVVHRVRSTVLAGGVGILAPCPHCLACPMAEAGDWCHFSERVERSSLHRRTKSGELPYEDEKFSYIVAGKQVAGPPDAGRIVRHPRKHPGHVQLELCTAQGIKRHTITRSQKADYKRARHAEWGDLWPG